MFMKKYILPLALFAAVSSTHAVVVVTTGNGDNNGPNDTSIQIAAGDYSSPLINGTETVNASNPITGVEFAPNFTLYSTASLTGTGSENITNPVVQSYQRELVGGNRQGVSLDNNNVDFDGYFALVYEQSSWSALTTGNVTVDGTSSMIYDTTETAGAFGNDFAYVIQNGSNFYHTPGVHQNTVDDGITGLDTMMWYSFDPTADGFNISNFSSPSGGVAGSTLTNITGVGVIMHSSRLAGQSLGDLNYAGFSADLTAIPESSSYGLIIGFAVLGAIIIRRRK